jgi:hypothetical protein
VAVLKFWEVHEVGLECFISHNVENSKNPFPVGRHYACTGLLLDSFDSKGTFL